MAVLPALNKMFSKSAIFTSCDHVVGCSIPESDWIFQLIITIKTIPTGPDRSFLYHNWLKRKIEVPLLSSNAACLVYTMDILFSLFLA